MRTKLVKTITAEGSAYYHRSRYLSLFSVRESPGRYIFKDTKGNVVEPTDLELELFHEMETGGMKVQNNWLTFLGIMALVNLIGLIVLISKIASVGSRFSPY